jgi:predicted peptidase
MNRFLKTCSVMAFMLGSLVLAGCNGATNRALELVGQDGNNKGFNFKTLTRGDHVRKYGVFIPLNYKPTQKYPVIIFLQGVGEGAGFGEGDGKNMTVGLGPFVALQRESFPFIVIFPQSSGGWDAESEYAQDVITALDDVSKQYSVDPDRVSLTGLSTGGYGTYAIGARYADRFAALVPMGSNSCDTSLADKLVRVSVRAYCSEAGDIFAGDNDRRMVEKIKTLGGNAEFIQTPTTGHDCWEYVYGSGDLFAWLQTQRRRPAAASTAIPAKSSSSAPAIIRSNVAAAVTTTH